MSEQKTTTFALEEASPDILAEIMRQAELRLENQSELARAVDQRALTLAGIAGAFAAATTAKAFEDWITQPLLAQLSVGVGASLLLSMLFAVLAARPANLYVTGNLPSSWIEDVKAKRSLATCLAETATLYDRYIRANDRRLRGRGVFLRISLWFLFLSPVAAGLVAFAGDFGKRAVW